MKGPVPKNIEDVIVSLSEGVPGAAVVLCKLVNVAPDWSTVELVLHALELTPLTGSAIWTAYKDIYSQDIGAFGMGVVNSFIAAPVAQTEIATQLDPNTGRELDWMLLDLVKGVEYCDGAGNRGMLKIWENEVWSFWKHPDGQWVSRCEATQAHIRVAAKYNSPRRA